MRMMFLSILGIIFCRGLSGLKTLVLWDDKFVLKKKTPP
jgi:hypothetical protein